MSLGADRKVPTTLKNLEFSGNLETSRTLVEFHFHSGNLDKCQIYLKYIMSQIVILNLFQITPHFCVDPNPCQSS